MEELYTKRISVPESEILALHKPGTKQIRQVLGELLVDYRYAMKDGRIIELFFMSLAEYAVR